MIAAFGYTGGPRMLADLLVLLLTLAAVFCLGWLCRTASESDRQQRAGGAKVWKGPGDAYHRRPHRVPYHAPSGTADRNGLHAYDTHLSNPQ